MSIIIQISILVVVATLTFVGLLFIRRRNMKKNVKTSQNKRKLFANQNKSEPPKKLESPKKPIAKTENINPRTIICPECIIESHQKEIIDPDSEEKITEAYSSVMIFNNWVPYVAHILSKHPESSRIGWAISCTREEIARLNREHKELPKSIQTIVELIQTHGKTADDEDYGIPYINLGRKGMISEMEQGTEKPKKKIEIIDDWAAKLGDITKLGKEEEQPAQKPEAEPEPSIDDDKLKKMRAISEELNALFKDLPKK
jgi:hypothetical protein